MSSKDDTPSNRRSTVNVTILASTVGCLLAAPTSAMQPALSTDPLIGIWGMEMSLGPMLHGELTVHRGTNGWYARMASVETHFAPTGDSVRFAFAANMGEFRGVLLKGHRAIQGFWIQPPMPVLGSAFTTPMTLAAQGGNTWSGNVRPLLPTYSVYLSVQRTASGSLIGVFRNPELNDNARFSQFRVSRIGDSVVFSAGPDSLKPLARVAGTLDSTGAEAMLVKGAAVPTNAAWRLSLRWAPLGRVLTLAPMGEAQAIGLFPRIPYKARYEYVPPMSDSDGWRTRRAAAVGFDESRLAHLVQRVADTLPAAPREPLIHSLLIARHGALVLEEYFRGYERDRPHDIRSVGKTLASILLGVAMKRGVNASPSTPLASLMAQQEPFRNADPRKGRITLAHVMTHSTGLACDDDDDDSPGNENTLQNQTDELDWWKYMMDLSMKNDPGAYYAYCSGTMNLMSAALTNATRTWLPAFFDASIAKPLHFGPYYFNLSPTLQGYLGGGAFLRPRDLLKLGQLYLDGGKWAGDQIVTPAWVTTSTTKQIEWPRRSENVSAGSDGYAWHLNTIKANGREYREYEANGNGGQLLMVLPELDLVVVFTGGNYIGGGVWNRWRNDLLPNAIIPAIVH